MSTDDRRVPAVPIDASLRRAFRRDAPAALARRNDAYLLGIALNVGQWLLVGCVGLLGLHRWHWNATELVLVFVAGIVSAIVADSLRWLFARRTVHTEYARMEADRRVWAMLDAERHGETHLPGELFETRKPGAMLVVDLAVGAFALWLLADHLPSLGSPAEAWQRMETSFRVGLAAVLAAPALSLLASAFAHRGAVGGFDELETRAGGRGIGLLLLAGALWFFGEGEDAARATMQFIHGATVVAGLLAVAGVYLMVRERTQLRRWLAASGDAAADAPRGLRGKARRRGRS